MPPLRLTASICIEQRRKLFRRKPHAGFFQAIERLGETLATVASRFSSGAPCATPMRKPASSAGSNGRGSSPAITASAWAQGATVFAIGPMESSVVGKRKRAVGRNALAARLEAGDAAERGRNARGAAGVAADGDFAHAVGGGDRAARGRAAGRARAIRRIARRAEMRIGADAGKGKLRHVGLGDDHRARLAQPPHDGRIAVSGLAFLGDAAWSRRASPRRRHRTNP